MTEKAIVMDQGSVMKGERFVLLLHAFNVCPSELFQRRNFTCLIFQHYRDAIPDGKTKTAWFADEFGFSLFIDERTFAQRARQDVE
jgi:hypothetical protein